MLLLYCLGKRPLFRRFPPVPGKRQTGLDWSHCMNKFTLHDILTFPNLLSFLRIPMAFLF